MLLELKMMQPVLVFVPDSTKVPSPVFIIAPHPLKLPDNVRVVVASGDIVHRFASVIFLAEEKVCVVCKVPP